MLTEIRVCSMQFIGVWGFDFGGGVSSEARCASNTVRSEASREAPVQHRGRSKTNKGVTTLMSQEPSGLQGVCFKNILSS